MPLPTSPAILLAAGGVFLVTGFFQKSSRTIDGDTGCSSAIRLTANSIDTLTLLGWVSVSIAATYHLVFITTWELPTPLNSLNSSLVRVPWIGDQLAIIGQRLISILATLMGVAFFDQLDNQRSILRRLGFLALMAGGAMLVVSANDFVGL
ncbi:MAG: hypothetical protein FJ267_14130, partial [Planctomycetes bacterium]|nr:hypothetical protein [Planctomycetota bacterium]